MCYNPRFWVKNHGFDKKKSNDFYHQQSLNFYAPDRKILNFENKVLELLNDLCKLLKVINKVLELLNIYH